MTLALDERPELTADEDLRRANRRLALTSLLLSVMLAAAVGWLAIELTQPAEVDVSGDFPLGTLVGEDNPSHFFEFRADGTYTYTENDYAGDIDVSGAFGINGDLYTEMTHDYLGLPMVPATYRWSFDGQRLTFELVGEDVIPDRVRAMTGQAFLLDASE